MNPRINKNKTENNKNNKNLVLNNRYHLNKNFRSVDNNNNYNRYSADLKKIRYNKYFSDNNKISINSTGIKNQSTSINKLQNKSVFDFNKKKAKYILNKKRNISNTTSANKSSHYNLINQINRVKLFRNKSLGEFYPLNQNKPMNLKNDTKSNNDDINSNYNSNPLYDKIFPNGSSNYFFKIKNFNKIKIKNPPFNKRITPSFFTQKMNSSNYCDASTNTYYENKKIIEIKPQIQINQKYKRPLMIDYFESEHKKFCHGFDKFKGRNKYKIPFFIVYKY